MATTSDGVRIKVVRRVRMVNGKKHVAVDHVGRTVRLWDQYQRIEFVTVRGVHLARCYVYARTTIVPHGEARRVRVHMPCVPRTLRTGGDTGRVLPSIDFKAYKNRQPRVGTEKAKVFHISKAPPPSDPVIWRPPPTLLARVIGAGGRTTKTWKIPAHPMVGPTADVPLPGNLDPSKFERGGVVYRRNGQKLHRIWRRRKKGEKRDPYDKDWQGRTWMMPNQFQRIDYRYDNGRYLARCFRFIQVTVVPHKQRRYDKLYQRCDPFTLSSGGDTGQAKPSSKARFYVPRRSVRRGASGQHWYSEPPTSDPNIRPVAWSPNPAFWRWLKKKRSGVSAR